MIYFRNMKTSETGAWLKGLLVERGVEVSLQSGPFEELDGISGVVSYGVPIPLDAGAGIPMLNARAGGISKFEELFLLDACGVPHVPFSGDGQGLTFPLLRRRHHHKGGRDILKIRDIQELRASREAQPDRFYTQVVPSTTEYRVWAFRGTYLATYEKVLKHPEWRKTVIGRNYDNGYAFEFRARELVAPKLRQLGIDAVKARGLDFGAVDILRTKDYPEPYVVLEVNSAPGVEGPKRVCLHKLADAIAAWAGGLG